MTLDKLAVMVASGFNDVKEDMSVLKTDVSELKSDVVLLKTDVTILKSDVSELKSDMSDVKLRLDYLAPQFEVRDLEKRVTRLEIKTGIRNNVKK